MNTFTINLALFDSKGVDLRQSLSIRSLGEGKVELVLVSQSVKPKGGKDEKPLGIVETPILARTIGAVITLAGGAS